MYVGKELPSSDILLWCTEGLSEGPCEVVIVLKRVTLLCISATRSYQSRIFCSLKNCCQNQLAESGL